MQDLRSYSRHVLAGVPSLPPWRDRTSQPIYFALMLIQFTLYRYLQNGNILAARTFLSHLVSQYTATHPDFVSSIQPSSLAVGKTGDGQSDEIFITKDPNVNWAQLAVRTCQRAQGDKNKSMREAWIRLCGTYQSKGGLLAIREVRKVSRRSFRYLFTLPRRGGWFCNASSPS